MPLSEENQTQLDIKSRLFQYWLLIQRFAIRYGPAVIVLIASAVIGWVSANGLSDYTQGGWEIHFKDRATGLDIHFHHWYYGLPLYLIAFLLIEWNANVSIFLFGLGETLAAHSYVNEGGIPSIIENGPTLRIPPEIYFPVATAFALLYAIFIIRREEWLFRAREREEIAVSYLCAREQMNLVSERLGGWASTYFVPKKMKYDREADIQYREWHLVDRKTNAEWQLHAVDSAFDDQLRLLNIRIEHIPLQGRAGQLDDWMVELDAALHPLVQPAVAGPQAAVKALMAQN